jgi:hypothetical protein
MWRCPALPARSLNGRSRAARRARYPAPAGGSLFEQQVILFIHAEDTPSAHLSEPKVFSAADDRYFRSAALYLHEIAFLKVGRDTFSGHQKEDLQHGNIRRLAA